MLLLPLPTWLLAAVPAATEAPTPPPAAELSLWRVVEAPAAPQDDDAALAVDDDYDHHRVRPDAYLRLSGGFASTRDSEGPDEDVEFDEGLALALAFGHYLGDADRPVAFALELEAYYSDQDASTEQAVRDLNVLAGFVNGLVDFGLTDHLTLFAGGGLGVAGVDVGTESDGMNDFEEEDGPFFAWQLRAGLRFWTTETFAVGLGYRFVNIDNVALDDDLGGADFDLETQQHVLELGLTFGF